VVVEVAHYCVGPTVYKRVPQHIGYQNGTVSGKHWFTTGGNSTAPSRSRL
jgi:hypothetical protein